MNHIVLRPLGPEDAEEMLAFARAAGGETQNLTFGPEGLPFGPEAEQAYLAAHGQSADSCELGAFDGARLVATGSVARVSRRPRMAHRFSLAVSVRKSHWNRGIATEMVQHLAERARGMGAEVLELQVLCSNAAAIHVHEKLGFSIAGTYRKFFRYGPGEYADAYWMNLYL